jgi:hypothetical protein
MSLLRRLTLLAVTISKLVPVRERLLRRLSPSRNDNNGSRAKNSIREFEGVPLDS